MASSFGWLDGDDTHRARMLEVVKLFQDQSSVDELGIGSVRDTFSDLFFPGTSVLHTRARYLLFIPWLLKDVTHHGWSVERSRKELRAAEVKLIRALQAGGETRGVIGSQAQDRLKTMPSAVYWPALRRFGLRRWDVTLDGHLRAAAQSARTAVDASDGDDASSVRDLGLDSSLPPAPVDLLTETSFQLSPDEADYLRGVFARLPGGSLLAWLARNSDHTEAVRIWQHPQVAEFPDDLRSAVDHARRFHHASHGAALLYNLMLARLSSSDDLTESYTSQIADWEEELEASQTFIDWDLPTFWGTVRRHNARLHASTESFLTSWFELARSGAHLSAQAQSLVQNRELLLKGSRSRLLNAAARENWSGAAGVVRLDFRWSVASQYLNDVFAGLEAA